MPTLAEQIAAYVTEARYEHLPKAVVEHTKRVMLDSLGVAIAGSATTWSRAAWHVGREEGGSPEATILRYGGRVG